ncbi:glycoside hydrolase family 25 protein [Flavobacterium sp. 3HN19-14]|uniref:glycoside hydrolase family 25 protein n=1 Tax=Flavobacterium sp. 3HN19-14 TaxID=3448133 RepID=UPI003EDF318E
MAKITTRKPVRRSPKKKSTMPKWLRNFAIALLIFAFIGLIGYIYRENLAYYFSFKTDKMLREEAQDKKLADLRIQNILLKSNGKLIGIDVSEYQGKIKWDSVKNISKAYPIDYVFIRATAGNDRPDNYFRENWAAAKKQNLIRGAYHYYRPNENSIAQAELFIKTVKLRKGDLPPVLDIEKLPEEQSLDSLKVGLKRWLNKVELYYGVKPIIYTGEKYYEDFLHEEFGDDYPFWIANYNLSIDEIKDKWLFWQFTERASVGGIGGSVDVNIFNGDAKELHYLTVGN